MVFNIRRCGEEGVVGVEELVIEGLTKRFGGLVALKDISFTVNRGEIVGLIGPNGAGKTTLFNCLTGFLRVDAGRVAFRGTGITNWPSHRICKLGVTRTFQVVQILTGLTVLENVMVGAFLRHPRADEARERALQVLAQLGMEARADSLAGGLTLPEKKRLEVAMCLATDPKLLMLDEAMAGLTPTEVLDSVKLLKDLRALGITLIVVEHVMEAIMPVADRLIVLESGQTIAAGRPEEILANERVIAAYLGDKYAQRRRLES
jgi:branched-chain amino acid transport system ATP-binding protein